MYSAITASLVPALGMFDSFRDLSLDASSEVRRDQVLGNAESLAARFNDLSAQLDAFDLESKEALEAKVGELHVLLNGLVKSMASYRRSKTYLSNRPTYWTFAIKCCGRIGTRQSIGFRKSKRHS